MPPKHLGLTWWDPMESQLLELLGKTVEEEAGGGIVHGTLCLPDTLRGTWKPISGLQGVCKPTSQTSQIRPGGWGALPRELPPIFVPFSFSFPPHISGFLTASLDRTHEEEPQADASVFPCH